MQDVQTGYMIARKDAKSQFFLATYAPLRESFNFKFTK
jgi:hypothetical protein